MGKQPKRIDLNKGWFTTKNHKYTIQPLELYYKRLVGFNQMQNEIVYGMRHSEAIEFVFELFLMMRTGKDVGFKESYMNVYERLANFCKPLENRDPNQVHDQSFELYLRFCTYFIFRQDENPADYDERIAEEKIDDWKNEYYLPDFFFVALRQLNLSMKQRNDFIKAVEGMR